MSIKQRVENQRVRVSMNQKHFCVQSGDSQLVQLEDGRYRELTLPSITLHREGEYNESPWTRYYDLTKPEDKAAIDALRAVLSANPSLHDDIDFRIRIVGEFEAGEPWPGYDDQSADQIIAYYKASPASARPPLENMLQYELSRVDEEGNSITDPAKVVAIEGLDKTQAKEQRNAAGAGVKM